MVKYIDRESKNLEFKQQLPKFINLIKTCIAFANGNGGQIVIGVEDNTQVITGIDDETRHRIYEDFPSSLYDSTQPALVASIYEKSINERSILVIDISPAHKKPCFLKSKGIPDGVYLRIGPHTKKANQHYVAELMRENQNKYYDSEAIYDADETILSKELLQSYYKMLVTKKRLLNDRIIVPSVANDKKYFPTVAGVLVFGSNPERFIPEAHIILARFKDDKSRELIQTEEITGCLQEQATKSLALLEVWLQQNFVLQNATLKARTIIPKVVLREAIINALLHRKYTIPGAIKISVYPNKLEVFSPGNFPGFVDINNLGDGTTFLRNPTLAWLARQLGLVEKLGSGIRLIFNSIEKASLKRPTFSEDGDFVKLTLYFEKVKQAAQTDEDAILKFVNTHKFITIGNVTSLLGVSRNTATRRLKLLVNSGKLMKVGKGPAVKYILSE